MLSVIMPVWNERATIGEILQQVLVADPGDAIEVIIVDDGSTDGTREWLVERARGEPRLRAIFHERNQGKAGAVRTGIAAALGESLVVQDADLEYDPRDFARLLERLRRGNVDVVNGNRYPEGRGLDSGLHLLANRIFTTVFNLVHAGHLSDLLSCYKMTRTEVAKGLPIRSRGFQLETELMSAFFRRGLRVVEIPISYRPRGYAEGKKLGWRDAFRILWAIAKFGLLVRP